MAIELNDDDHGHAQAAATPALVGRRRRSTGIMTGAISTRPMTSDAELRLRNALQRIIADMVDKHLKGDRE